MKFWKAYIERQKAEYMRQTALPHFIPDLAVVIPCFCETELPVTLRSLCECNAPEVKTLVLIVINSGAQASREAVVQNRKTYEEALLFAKSNNSENLLFFPLLFEDLPRKHAGVGLARKIGMDLAVSRFFEIENREGILVSLDADCTVSPDFLASLAQAYRESPALCCTVQNFRHRINPPDVSLEPAIRQYEEYIFYFSRMLRWTGFPYFLHTIGSAFSVSADAYVRAGGMGRQQGGEDFYFLHKVFPLGESRFLAGTYVYPLARVSDRIPFGTGPALRKIAGEPDGQMRVYSVEAFSALKKLFDSIPLFYESERAEALIETLPDAVREFLVGCGFGEEIEDCRQNSASMHSFRKRFFQHFNAFKTIKYLNFAHAGHFPREKIGEALQKSSRLL